MRDIKTILGVSQSIAPALRTTTVSGTGADLQGFNSAMVVFAFGAITDGTHTPTVEESDASGSGYTTVAAADLVGTLAAGTATTVQRVGYIGAKRYIRAVVTVTGSPSTGGLASAEIVVGHASQNPVA